MSDDEADPELLELLRKSLGISSHSDEISSETNVLRDAEYIYSNSIDVAIDRNGTLSAAMLVWEQMQQRSYSTKAWSEHELHPKAKDEATLNFIFTMDLLNFSFWSESSEEDRFCVEYRGKRWTGYWSLVACLQRALDEGKNFLRSISLNNIAIVFSFEINNSHPVQAYRSSRHHSGSHNRRRIPSTKKNWRPRTSRPAFGKICQTVMDNHTTILPSF